MTHFNYSILILLFMLTFVGYYMSLVDQAYYGLYRTEMNNTSDNSTILEKYLHIDNILFNRTNFANVSNNAEVRNEKQIPKGMFATKRSDTEVKIDKLAIKKGVAANKTNDGQVKPKLKEILIILKKKLKSEKVINVTAEAEKQKKIEREKAMKVVAEAEKQVEEFLAKSNVTDLTGKKTKFAKYPVYVCSVARLGNLMFEYATVYGMGRFSGRPCVFIQKNKEFSRIFPNTTCLVVYDPHCAMLDNKYRGFGESRSGYFSNDSVYHGVMTHDGRVKIGTYLQHPFYFKGLQDQVRKEFTFSETLLKNATRFLLKTKSEYFKNTKQNETGPVHYVGIHIRRGDIAGRFYYKRGYRVAGQSYFDKAINYFRKKYNSSIFIVATQDDTWAKKTLDPLSNDDIYYSPFKKGEQDMALMTQCNHSISTTGSYSWWVNYLVKGESVYYKNLYAPDSEMARINDNTTIFLPKWIGFGD